MGLAVVLLSACGDRSPPAAQPLPALEIEPGSVTVSGISSGGYMAVQFHVAHSGLVNGVGVLAAGPFYCAESSLRRALGPCMRGGSDIPTDRLVTLTSELALEGQIDPIADLALDSVWIYRGAADEVVAESVVDSLEQYYRTLVEPERVERIVHPQAAHVFPTLDMGGACDKTGSPYVANCGFDAAGALLTHLYAGLGQRGDADGGELIEFDQRPYAVLSASSALAERGWVYVPDACAGSSVGCRLHIVFHGCRQGTSFVGERFVREAGYLEWAASNRIVVLFPQIEPGVQPLNPNGCWDWWGYEDARYAVRNGPQQLAIRAMIADLRGETAR
jgi:poly(3-hydroxybutyrate) depolymerase